MDHPVSQAARQPLAVLESSLVVCRASLACFTRLGEMHLAVAGATLSASSAGALRCLAARTPEEAAGALADDMAPQIARLFLYGCILREINRQVGRSTLAAMARADGPAE